MLHRRDEGWEEGKWGVGARLASPTFKRGAGKPAPYIHFSNRVSENEQGRSGDGPVAGFTGDIDVAPTSISAARLVGRTAVRPYFTSAD